MKNNKSFKGIPDNLSIGLSDEAFKNILIKYGMAEEKKKTRKKLLQKFKEKLFE